MLLIEKSLPLLVMVMLVLILWILFISRNKYKKMAFQDFSSGLPNRHALHQFVHKKRKKKVAIFYIDLDNFKYIYDTYGHIKGDQVVLSFGNKILKLKDAKQGFFRIGGDEFVFISDYVNKDYTKKVAESLLKNINHSIYFKDQAITIRGSIGISIGRLHNNFELLLDEADQALQVAKQQGKNQIVYHDANHCKFPTVHRLC
ncbi:GGDEF domain-containing protein [Gracilibacillus saliphilus]|uniref:GGDEF domain-containing protein n=1 Tax=Gracilibacillus saliphilus TaxID=543890 RepID=UPI0013D26CC8|nr:GGDEF domain-containing protein [Gracilibacillus saliphilus]